MLLVLTENLALLLQQTVTPYADPGNWFQYGLAGVLAFLIGLLLKYIMQRDKHDQETALKRSEMYRDDNRIRDERLYKILQSVDVNGDKFVEATNGNIDKFVQLINKVMEQSNYQTQTLVELKTIISKLPSEFQVLKNDINLRLEKIGVVYELKKKVDHD